MAVTMWTRLRQRLGLWLLGGACPRCGYPAPKARTPYRVRLDVVCEFDGCTALANPVKTADGTYRCAAHKGQ